MSLEVVYIEALENLREDAMLLPALKDIDQYPIQRDFSPFEDDHELQIIDANFKKYDMC